MYWFSCGLLSPFYRAATDSFLLSLSLPVSYDTWHFIHGFCLSLGFLVKHALGCAEMGILFLSTPPSPETHRTSSVSIHSLGSFFFFQLREICLLHDCCVFDFFFHFMCTLALLTGFSSFVVLPPFFLISVCVCSERFLLLYLPGYRLESGVWLSILTFNE